MSVDNLDSGSQSEPQISLVFIKWHLHTTGNPKAYGSGSGRTRPCIPLLCWYGPPGKPGVEVQNCCVQCGGHVGMEHVKCASSNGAVL